MNFDDTIKGIFLCFQKIVKLLKIGCTEFIMAAEIKESPNDLLERGVVFTAITSVPLIQCENF